MTKEPTIHEGQELERVIEAAERYDGAKRRALANLERGFHLGGQKLVSREELHER